MSLYVYAPTSPSNVSTIAVAGSTRYAWLPPNTTPHTRPWKSMLTPCTYAGIASSLAIIGKVGIRTYAVEEINGLIFIYLGDAGRAPQPLVEDLPRRPDRNYQHKTGYILDPDTVVLGIHRKCAGNWRLAAESGPDPGHVLVHRNSALILSQDIGLALGEKRIGPKSIVVDEKAWPKGVYKDYDHMEFVMENKALNIKARGKPTQPVKLHQPIE